MDYRFFGGQDNGYGLRRAYTRGLPLRCGVPVYQWVLSCGVGPFGGIASARKRGVYLSVYLGAFLCLWCSGVGAQTFALEKVNDSCHVLVLTTEGAADEWRLPYSVYQFRTGDVDGDGVEEALVGVVKATRFYPEKSNRLFVFKNSDGRLRPLWLGSRLGEELVDYCVADGKLVSIERCRDGSCNVDEWEWTRFGPRFSRYIATNIPLEKATIILTQYEKNTDTPAADDARHDGLEPAK